VSWDLHPWLFFSPNNHHLLTSFEHAFFSAIILWYLRKSVPLLPVSLIPLRDAQKTCVPLINHTYNSFSAALLIPRNGFSQNHNEALAVRFQIWKDLITLIRRLRCTGKAKVLLHCPFIKNAVSSIGREKSVA
jgi:hypothetical protein